MRRCVALMMLVLPLLAHQTKQPAKAPEQQGSARQPKSRYRPLKAGETLVEGQRYFLIARREGGSIRIENDGRLDFVANRMTGADGKPVKLPDSTKFYFDGLLEGTNSSSFTGPNGTSTTRYFYFKDCHATASDEQ